MDSQDLVRAEREASSARGVAPPPRKRIPADAYQNSPQPRIHGIDRQARDEIEGRHCRIFPDRTRKDNHRSARRNVPLGTIVQQRSKRQRTSSRTGRGAQSEMSMSACLQLSIQRAVQPRRLRHMSVPNCPWRARSGKLGPY
jgi:hypothetical protein